MILLTQGQSMERLFDLDMQLIADSVWTMAAVFVLYVALGYYLFDPVKRILQERQDRIRKELARAQEGMEKARAFQEEYEARLKNVDREREEILRKAAQSAQKKGQEEAARAGREAALILENARREADLERQRAADEMRKEMIVVAAAMAQKAIEAVADSSMQERLADKMFEKIGEISWPDR